MTPSLMHLVKLNIPVAILMCVLLWKVDVTHGIFLYSLMFYSLIYLIGYNFYHRVISHGQLEITKFGQIITGYLGLFCMLGDALTYSLFHRYHHKYSDTVKDLHSPVHGRYHSFIGWMFKENNIGQYQFLIKDLTQSKFNILILYNKYQYALIWVTIIALLFASYELALGLLISMVSVFILEMLANSFLTHSPSQKTAVRNTLYSWISLSTYHDFHHTNSSTITRNDPVFYLVPLFKLLRLTK
jgi:fatty-acid desaturase